MPALRFTLPGSQTRTPLIGAGVLVLIGVAAAVFGKMPFASCVWFVALVLLVVYFLVMYGSYAEFDDTGLRSRRGAFGHHVTWDNVREVALDPKSGQVLICYRHNGKHFKIGAPISGGLSVDSDYRAKVAQVLAFVAARVPTQPAAPAQARRTP